MHYIYGQWGFEDVQRKPVTIGMNIKGGMDGEELKKYILNNIVPLFPDAEDVPGKRVLLKVDSGPGRNNMIMLPELRCKCFYVIAGVPNSTGVTQETDKSFSVFKSIYRLNL